MIAVFSFVSSQITLPPSVVLTSSNIEGGWGKEEGGECDGGSKEEEEGRGGEGAENGDEEGREGEEEEQKGDGEEEEGKTNLRFGE